MLLMVDSFDSEVTVVDLKQSGLRKRVKICVKSAGLHIHVAYLCCVGLAVLFLLSMFLPLGCILYYIVIAKKFSCNNLITL